MKHAETRSTGPAESPRLFARLPTVIAATGLGRSTIYRLIASGTFPPPVHLGPRAVAWRWTDLDKWSESCSGESYRHRVPVPRAGSRAGVARPQAHP